MKKILQLLFSSCFFVSPLVAQPANDPAGSYFLEGVQETASGFQLKPNYTFTFFFTYAGLDRYGSGRWTQEKNTVVFNSRTKPARDFRLLSAGRVNDNFVTVKFTDKNPAIVNGIECILYTARGRQKLFTDKTGTVKFPKNTVDSIQIFSPLFPDHPYTFIVTNKIQNNFEFAFEKWVAEVFFEDFTLLFTNNMLVGQHPLLNGNQFRYVKDK
ncbi:MAG TPA: hypothetical protein PLL71_05205 [Agriterribacter sp.]|nr:hypothetical protein [Agriterribacter sp.]HRQ49204.1 hypothetical protein [Agriterribacter sp.]